jgi:hypothetical protein
MGMLLTCQATSGQGWPFPGLLESPGMKEIGETVPMEPAGCIIMAGQEAKEEIL